MTESKIAENINREWTLVSPISDGAAAWLNAKTEMLVMATWSVNSTMYGNMMLIIPKISLEAGKTTSFNMGDKYNTGSQMHLQVNITYDSSGLLSGVTPSLYEGANTKSGAVYRFFYR